MLQTWRWFGPSDSVSLDNVVQAGATGVVTSLHEVPTGELWELDEILKRKQMIEAAGLIWSVVESVPLHNDIKTRSGDFKRHIKNYQQTLVNLGKAGINVVCYNFMPVVDWTRTNLNYNLPNKSQALRFEMTDFVAYDVYILERENAAHDYSAEMLLSAKERLSSLSDAQRALLEQNIIAGLPGGEGSYDRNSIREAIAEFIAIGDVGMRENLFAFLRDIIHFAEEAGVRMCIHPDDPPFSLFGLPRVVSTRDDARAILDEVPSISNGLTMCAGSFGARADNNLVELVREFGSHIHFVHLRNIRREADGSFYESEHLDGDNDMVGLVSALLDEEADREKIGRLDRIPMRPDHGHLLADEMGNDDVRPGYSFAGRMKGLAELRGVIHVLEQTRGATI